MTAEEQLVRSRADDTAAPDTAAPYAVAGAPVAAGGAATDPSSDRLGTAPSAAWAIPAAAIVVGTLIRLPQLAHSLNELHAFRYTQTAFVAREYAASGIDLFHTPLPVFGPSTDAPMELPLVQAAGSLLIDAGINADAAMRIIGLIGFQITAVLLAVLVHRWHGRLAAAVAIVLFEFSPFALGWGASPLIEFPAVACAIGMVVGLDRWFTTGSRWALAGGAVSAWLAFLIKATTAPAWCMLLLGSAAAVFLSTRAWRRIAVGLLAGPAVGAFIGLVWTRYADGVKDDDQFTRTLTSSSLRDWNFGTIDQRVDPANYAKILGRVASEIAGPLGLGIVLAIVGVALAPRGVERVRRASWLATAAVGPLLFFNLYVVHNYYLAAVFPAVVAAMAVGIVAVSLRFRSSSPAVVAAVCTAVVIAGTVVMPLGWRDVRQWSDDQDLPASRVAIQAITAPDDLIVVAGCDWDPTTLYYAERRGLMLKDEVTDYWSGQDVAAYHYLYDCTLGDEDASKYLPSGYSLEPTAEAGLYRIVPSA